MSTISSFDLGEIRLLLAAVFVYTIITCSLTILWRRFILKKIEKRGLFLLFLLTVEFILFAYSPDGLIFGTYLGFERFVNSIDYLFNILRMGYIAYLIILLNLFFSVLALVRYLSKKDDNLQNQSLMRYISYFLLGFLSIFQILLLLFF